MAARTGGASPGDDARFARSVAFWLRAYPRRWRAVRTAELTAVLADLAGPAARRVDARTAAGLVVGGCATRWRGRPPLRLYLAYRLVDRRLPPEHHPWVRDDLESPTEPLRRSVVPLVVVAAYLALLAGLRGTAPEPWERWFFSGFAVLHVAGTLLTRRTRLQRARLRHLTLRPGEPVAEGAFVAGAGPRLRVRATEGTRLDLAAVLVAALAWGSAVLAVPEVLAVVGTSCPGTEPDACGELVTAPFGAGGRTVLAAVVGVALLAGLALVPLVRRRVRLLVPRLPAQPARELVDARPEQRTLVLLLCLLVAGEALLEATGRVVLLLTPLGAPVAMLLLPSAVVLARFARTRPDLAWADLRHVAARGGLPAQDVAEPRAVTVVGPVAPGTVLGAPSGWHGELAGYPGYPAVPLPAPATFEGPDSAARAEG